MTPGVLDRQEASAVVRAFGASDEQVRRDHVISHVLAALAALPDGTITFFGGTALSRTHLPDLRLSEDLDLLAMADRAVTADLIEATVRRALRRPLGMVTFTPRLRVARESQASTLSVGAVRLRVQLLSHIGYPAWPTEVRSLHQRYSDAPPATLRVLTAPAFAAAKLSAWHDRAAPRDLYDMWGLAERGVIDSDAASLFSRLGPLTRASAVSFTSVPDPEQWDGALAHQCILRVSASEAAGVVAGAWRAAAAPHV